METKEKFFTSSKELIESKFSRTWKMETKEKVLTSSKFSFLFSIPTMTFFFSEPKKIKINKRKISYSLVIKSRNHFIYDPTLIKTQFQIKKSFYEGC